MSTEKEIRVKELAGKGDVAGLAAIPFRSDLDLHVVHRVTLDDLKQLEMFAWPESIFGLAAAKGSVEIMEWLRQRGAVVAGNDGGFANENSAMYVAAENGHTHVLDWLRQHGAVERDACREYGCHILNAAKNHLSTLKWFWKTGHITAHDLIDHDIFTYAMHNNKFDTLDWLVKHKAIGLPPDKITTLLYSAIMLRSAHPKRWLWLINHKIATPENCALQNCWLLAMGVYFNSDAYFNSDTFLKSLQEIGAMRRIDWLTAMKNKSALDKMFNNDWTSCTWRIIIGRNRFICVHAAAARGHINVLQFLMDKEIIGPTTLILLVLQKNCTDQLQK
ncbi:MAG: ankyrin repeat domain-containing protein [Betaproteobacteria bacterium]|nr:ankyrin repeat domain-containing protein [Betaproteobacteria bacterium]